MNNFLMVLLLQVPPVRWFLSRVLEEQDEATKALASPSNSPTHWALSSPLAMMSCMFLFIFLPGLPSAVDLALTLLPHTAASFGKSWGAWKLDQLRCRALPAEMLANLTELGVHTSMASKRHKVTTLSALAWLVLPGALA